MNPSVLPLPAAEIAETALLSCLFREPARFFPAFAAAGVTEETFHVRRRLYRAAKEHFDAFQSLDITAFVQAQIAAGHLDALGGPGEIAEVAGYTDLPGIGAWRQWLQQAKEAQAQRIASAVETVGLSAEDAVNALQTALEAIQSVVRGPSAGRNAKQAAQTFLNEWTASYEHGDMPGDPTGYEVIDRLSGGMLPGQLIVIGGRESSGKSVILYEVAARKIVEGKTVSIHTLEMMAGEVVGRMISSHHGIRYSAITKPREATTHELKRIAASAKSLAQGSYWIDDSGGQTLDRIEAEAQRIRDEAGRLDLIVVDYLQLIEGSRARNETRESEVARVSRGLKQLAKRMRCPVLTATQLNSEGESRESRAIQQDADWLLYIARDGLKVVKMRNARRGDVLPLQLKGDTQQFVEITHRPDPAGGERSHRRYGT